MLKITNLTNNNIDISQDLQLKPYSTINTSISMNNKLHHLLNMGLIRVQELDKIKNSDINTNSTHHQAILQKIKNGNTQPSISLITNKHVVIDAKSEFPITKNKKNNKKSQNK